MEWTSTETKDGIRFKYMIGLSGKFIGCCEGHYGVIEQGDTLEELEERLIKALHAMIVIIAHRRGLKTPKVSGRSTDFRDNIESQSEYFGK